MAVMLSLEENKNEDNDSVLENLFTAKSKHGRTASWKQYVPRIITGVGTALLISIIIWLSQRAYSCPRLWIGFEGKCFYFSEVERNWTSSRDDCHTRRASLAVIQSKEELEFALRYKGFPDHWIGLSRQNPSRRWEWEDGTKFNSSLFLVGGGEDFAFLNDQKVTSARSSGERHWICTKPQSRRP
ncbi:C-type lectin domain family 2 member B-like isoform X2 [Cygnus atratus]|uniref:C-type lectin domain family 2 member B-like isoform X2 n=1 Tax=Cygnus atratus TaxID=8868 RepID=UPI0015D5EB72|nr:C-type lectin domain family 2 member B-like isoform X2 [Cygnus atratus]XP_035426315.1 C-type lectin domain family 2 member B-like isoform X2 [Cygnus atratus]XP_035426316.1 C-type lectin domain family 2 member B-like isoform X2 [Cygnus atratus]XP_035426317.1 C-type lectin domain family 2 member B-like isoform X2 [Cygnus atratus]